MDTRRNEFTAEREGPGLGRVGYFSYWRKRRAFARKVESLVSSLSDEELHDWALVYAFKQLRRYRKLSNRYAILYRSVEVAALLLASVVTVLAALNARAWVTASIAAAVTFLTGFRQINLLYENWISCVDVSTQLNSLVNEYRVLLAGERSHVKGQKLVEEADKAVAERVRAWKRDLKSTTPRKEQPQS